MFLILKTRGKQIPLKPFLNPNLFFNAAWLWCDHSSIVYLFFVDILFTYEHPYCVEITKLGAQSEEFAVKLFW